MKSEEHAGSNLRAMKYYKPMEKQKIKNFRDILECMSPIQNTFFLNE